MHGKPSTYHMKAAESVCKAGALDGGAKEAWNWPPWCLLALLTPSWEWILSDLLCLEVGLSVNFSIVWDIQEHVYVLHTCTQIPSWA